MSTIFLKKNESKTTILDMCNAIELKLDKQNTDKNFVKHISSANKQWSNSIYSYNKNYPKYLPILDKIAIRLIRSYFNLFIVKQLHKKGIKNNKKPVIINRVKDVIANITVKKLLAKRKIKIFKKLKKLELLLNDWQKDKPASLLRHDIKKIKIKTITSYARSEYKLNLRLLKIRQRIIKKKRKSIKKIYISKAELKHTNSRAIFTLYLYNAEERSLLRRLNSKRVNPLLSNNLNNFQNKVTTISLQGTDLLANRLGFILDLTTEKLKWLLKYEGFIVYWLKLKKRLLNDYVKKSFKKQKMVLYYKRLISFNRRKFKNTYLTPLNLLVNKIYGKNVEFNLVNLKYLHLNSDIMSQAIARKLKKKKLLLLRLLKSFLNSAKLHTKIGRNYHISNQYGKRDLEICKRGYKINPIINLKEKKNQETKNKNLIEKTKVRNFDLETFLTCKILENENVNVNENTGLLKQLSDAMFLKKNDIYSRYLKTTTLESVRYKWVNGIRIEATGPLSKRLKNRRSQFKYKYNGNLKNIYCSFKGISSALLRGHAKSNIQLTKLLSKNRKGSFGLKGWVSSI